MAAIGFIYAKRMHYPVLVFRSVYSTIWNDTEEPESGVTMLNIIVENCEQYGQQNIV